jgi:hypothetical protein
MRTDRVRLSRGARVALGAGLAYVAVVTVLACTVPVESGSEATTSGWNPSTGTATTAVVHQAARTLVGENGTKVLWLVTGIPLLVLAAELAELRWCRRWGHPGPGGVTLLILVALGLLVLAGAFSIGPALVPLEVAVALAAGFEGASRQPALPPPPPPPRSGVSRPAPWAGSAPR